MSEIRDVPQARDQSVSEARSGLVGEGSRPRGKRCSANVGPSPHARPTPVERLIGQGYGRQGLTADPMGDSIANDDHCVALTDPIRERSSDTNATVPRSSELPERYCGEWMCAAAFDASLWDACGRLGTA